MYELLFWKYKEEVYLNNQEVYEQLSENETVAGLEFIPVGVILNRISNVFADWEKVDENSFKNPNGKGAFHIMVTPQSIQINCYGTQGKTMDKLCDVLEEYNCPLYDPQVPVRYDEFAN